MAMMSAGAPLKARLQQKARLRPHRMMRKKMPDGAGLLGKLPERLASEADDEAADQEYCKAIDAVASVFGKQSRAQTTADEHKMYARLFDGWLVRKGFGSYFDAEVMDGHCVAVRARKRGDGTLKVIKPQMLVGYLLDMSVNSEHTPKGGHAADIAARAAMEVASACGPRAKMRCAARARRPARAAAVG